MKKKQRKTPLGRINLNKSETVRVTLLMFLFLVQGNGLPGYSLKYRLWCLPWLGGTNYPPCWLKTPPFCSRVELLASHNMWWWGCSSPVFLFTQHSVVVDTIGLSFSFVQRRRIRQGNWGRYYTLAMPPPPSLVHYVSETLKCKPFN